MSPELKRHHDEAIRARVTGLWQYRSCKTLLTYVSTSIEVDTRALILTALEEGKRVAVPRCVPGTRDMEFYYIRGLEELEPGTFGVLGAGAGAFGADDRFFFRLVSGARFVL